MVSPIVLSFTLLGIGALAIPQGGENIPDECKPKPRDPSENNEVCCRRPHPTQKVRDAHKECRELLGFGPLGQPGGSKLDLNKLSCFDECIFSKLGHLTADMKLNPTETTSKLVEEYGAAPEWKPVVEAAATACVQAGVGEIPPEVTCRSGSRAVYSCFKRAIYMNCPANFKSQSEFCNAERATMEKCPNVMPPPPFRPPSS